MCSVQVNTQLYSKREKDNLADLIRIMIAYNITYHQQRNLDGQYSYDLEPSVWPLTPQLEDNNNNNNNNNNNISHNNCLFRS